MHARFASEQAVGVFSRELDGGVFDAGFFAGSLIENDSAHALALGPAQVHAQQNGGPVLRLGAAGSGLDGHDGVEVIGFAGEERLGFELADVALGCRQLAVEVFQKIVALLGIGFFLGQADVGFDVARDRREFLVGGNLLFGALAIAENG